MSDRPATLTDLLARRAILESRVAEAYRIAAAANAELLVITRSIEATPRADDDLLPLKQAAGLARVHIDTARRWAVGGKGVRRGGRWFLPRSVCIGMAPQNAEVRSP